MSRNSDETRLRILDATLSLLEAGAPKGARMSDIAKAAGVSRQAVYLHFGNRAELLIAATLLHDERLGSDQRLAASRTAKTGRERLDAFIVAWTGYMPEIYGIAKAFVAMLETDEEAAAAWNKRMQDMREGCEAAVLALKRDGDLAAGLTVKSGTDLLWMLLSIRNWEQLTIACNWSQKKYRDHMKSIAHKVLVDD